MRSLAPNGPHQLQRRSNQRWRAQIVGLYAISKSLKMSSAMHKTKALFSTLERIHPMQSQATLRMSQAACIGNSNVLLTELLSLRSNYVSRNGRPDTQPAE